LNVSIRALASVRPLDATKANTDAAQSPCIDAASRMVRRLPAQARQGYDVAVTRDHSHGNDDHGDHSELSELELRVRALHTVLEQKGYIESAALDALIDAYQTKIGPRNGARVIARAWVDPAFREWLLTDATAAIASLGYSGRQGEHMVAVENTRSRHNLVVCTLCSCYPWSVLGLPPTWYKSAPYRARAVRDPRGVLGDFGVTLPESTEIRVWDSTAEVRYLVIPMRPHGTGHLNEEQLAALVTRDSMIGTGLARTAAGG
jgi:nitrile hydratase